MKTAIGQEFIPDYRDLFANSLTVPSGTTHVLRGDVEHDAIYVDGELRFATDAPTTLRYVTIQGPGRVWCGDEANPMLQPVRLIKRDIALDTEKDPFQWGHGIVCFGQLQVRGRKLQQTWSLIQPAAKGDTTLVLDYVPADWNVGDVLLIPDTKQLGEYTFNVPNPIRFESPVTIAEISGNTITLSKPLDFEHLDVRHELTGAIVARPAVANCTRNVVFESENPAETMNRGHIGIIHTGSADFRYASIIGMGRTTGAAIDNTPLDESRPGTNQIAKYAFHGHHVAHHDESSDHGGIHIIGCYVDGLGGSKWGIVDHTSPGFHAEENVITGHTGSGLVTEDGNETDYLFKRNFCHGASGNRFNGKFNMLLNAGVGQFAPGAEGAGIWNHSPAGRTLDNYCINNKVGIQWMYRDHPGKKLVQKTPPVENARNTCVSNVVSGVEEWNSPLGFYADDQVCANNGNGFVMGNGEPGNLILNNPTLVNTKIVRTGEKVNEPFAGSGVSASRAYTTTVVVNGGSVSGFKFGLRDARSVKFKDVDARGNGKYDIYFQLVPFDIDLEGTLFDTKFPEDVEPPPPVEVWALADIGPPFAGDDSLRVRAGMIERKA